MANIYVRSTDGSDSDNGSTWALAKATAVGAAAIDNAGDVIFFSQSHSESTAGAVNPAFAGTASNPVKLICANDGAEPPTALATGAIIANTGNNNMAPTGFQFAHGITFNIGGSASGGASFIFGGAGEVLENCTWNLNNTGAGGRVRFGTSSPTTAQAITLRNPSFKFANIGQAVQVFGNLIIKGGQALAGGTSPTGFITAQMGGPAASAFVDGFDFSAWSSSLSMLAGNGTASCGRFIFRNCKLPSGWNGAPISGTIAAPGLRVEMRNCSAGDVNYALWIRDYCGDIFDDVIRVRTGGASDGTTPISWLMETSAAPIFPVHALVSPEIAKWNDTVGSPITVTVDILHDSTTDVKDNEVWLEVQYLGTSGFPRSLFVDDAVADVLATAADQDSSSETWDTTDLTNPNTQKLSVTFTPQEKGLIIATVHVAKPSYLVFIDPKLQLS